MIFRGAKPHVHLAVGIEVGVDESEETSFIVIRASDALDERGKIERDEVDLNSNLRKVLLNHGNHLLARFISGIGDDGEFHAISLRICQHAAVKKKPLLGTE